MRISGFMHEINNPKLTKRLNEHVPKTMEEMMIATTAFIRGEAATACKKKGHVTPKEILAAEANKFQPPPPMVTPVEKRNSNKFCDFHNDKGHNTDEFMQLKKQIEELVRARKLSHLIKENKQGREQPKTRRKEATAKDKPTTIYMVRSWQRTVKQKSVTPKEERTRPANFTVALHPNFPDQEVVVGGSLSDKGRTELCSLLKKNLDIFAWQPSNMTGVPRSVAEHRLNIREGCPPVRQKKRGQAPERSKAIQAEVQKLVIARIMREVYYHDWLSNPVMVELLGGYPFKCFLDTYKGYHQIQLAEADEENTAFHTGQEVYCYTKMPFGLKNAGATYQRLMDKTFESQMGRNIEVYVDDLVVKSHTEVEMVRDIEETFRTLRKINMKLNPKKCSFGLAEGVFLGYVITPEGIKPCPDKTTSVLQLPSPQTVKEVQSLNGKLASLNRFLSKSVEKSLPQFQTLKKRIKKSDFRWTAEAEQAFQQLKHHLSDLPLLVAPMPQEELIMYLPATHRAISAVMSRPDVAGRLQKWSIILGEHNITYRPRTSIKGQILADFLNEMPGDASQGVPVAVTQEEPWTLFTDGSSCVDGSGAWVILTNPEGVEFTYALRFQFAASNNEAEYEALVVGLRIATQMGVKNVQVNVDSKLVANQVLGTYVAKKDNMIKYLEIVKGLVSEFTTFSISQVPRSRNKKADALSKIATSFAHLSKQVLVEVLETKSITGKEVTAVIEEEGPTWMTELVDYLKEGILSEDEKEARKLCLKAHQYELREGVLYKRSFFTPWLRCVGPLQAEYVMEEIHEGSCSMHAGPRSVVAKAIRLGYYWSTMHKDAGDMIRKCSDCQIHRPVTRHPQQPLTPITAPWLFYKWGIDIAGLFSKGTRKVKFLIVAMDYFIKWIEAKAVATITDGQVKKFVWDNIVCRFGILGEIISDNGKQFADNPFKDWCDKLNITQRFASVKHPQSNGLVERANRSLREGIKACLEERNKNWVEELPHVLWTHRTMIKSSHGDTPLSLTYGTEAVIPAEIEMPTYCTAVVDMVNNDEELRLNLDLLEERRELTAISEAKSKSKMMKYYNARVRGVAFKPGDFIYRSNDASHAVAGGNLGPKWEGPYDVTEALGNGAYKLRSTEGTVLPKTWNVTNLKRCYL
nr:reverse transcriptase domain-containing protein [Tanacetum cinerariifolium]